MNTIKTVIENLKTVLNDCEKRDDWDLNDDDNWVSIEILLKRSINQLEKEVSK